MADQTNNYDNTNMAANMTGVTKRRGMTTSIISAFPQSNMVKSGSQQNTKQGTLFGSVLTILSIMIGSGAIGIPYAMYKLSISVGMGLLFLYVILSMITFDLYYESSRLTGCKSLSEIGFYCFGKKSVYIINLVIFAKNAAMPIIYFILAGTWWSQIMSKIEGVPDWTTERYPWVILAGIWLIYFALKKDITAFKPLAFFLFWGILIFIVILAYHMFHQQKEWNHDVNPHSGYYTPFNEHKSKMRLIYYAETILVGVSFQTVFFPVINNLKDNSKRNIMTTWLSALFTATILYVICTFVSIYAFGHDIHSDILKNVGENKGWETIVLGVLFAIVGSLHIPLIFYVGKDALLIIIFTFFYTEEEKEDMDVNAQDVSHVTISQNIGNTHKSKLLEKNENLLENKASQLEGSKSISVLRKTTIIPNIDVTLTRQLLAFNPTTSMLYQGGIKAYDNELKEQEANIKEPSHKDLPLWIYLLATFSVFGFDIAVACFVDDISIVFGFVGALSISMVFFVMPGAYYLKAVHLSNEPGSMPRKIAGYLYIFIGFSLMFGGIASIAVKIYEDGNEDPVEPE